MFIQIDIIAYYRSNNFTVNRNQLKDHTTHNNLRDCAIQNNQIKVQLKNLRLTNITEINLVIGVNRSRKLTSDSLFFRHSLWS